MSYDYLARSRYGWWHHERGWIAQREQATAYPTPAAALDAARQALDALLPITIHNATLEDAA